MQDEERRRAICVRALELRDVWLAIARVLGASRAKRIRVAVTIRRCRQLARICEESSVHVWEATDEELAGYESQNRDLGDRADRAMLTIGMAGHELKKE